ncbi:unnamed protein product, partial [Mesorhabditis spiculigera]
MQLTAPCMGQRLEPYAKRLIDEWLKQERHIRRIRIFGKTGYLEISHPDGSRLKGRIQRKDGEFLDVIVGPGFPPEPELISFLNESVTRLWDLRLPGPLPHYIGLKLPEMTLRTSSVQKAAGLDELYAKLLIDEWLKGERHIRFITIICTPGYPDYPALLRPYAKFSRHRGNYWLAGRIRRKNGELLMVSISESMITLRKAKK